MKNNIKDYLFLFLLFCIFFCFYNYILAATEYQIVQDSMADSVEYLNGDTLIVGGIPLGGFFGIKSGGVNIFEVWPNGTAGFILKNTDFLGGYLNRWETNESSSSTLYSVRVTQNNTYYRVNKDGIEINGSPFRSFLYNLRFFASETGVYTFQETSLTCQETNVRGQAKSENGFLISFSCLDHDIGDGVHYGVNIDEETMLLSGEAWSSEGWITFSEKYLQGCPDGNCQAILLENGELSGWGRTSSGWIHLDNYTEGAMEAEIILGGNEFFGWAYGDGNYGWISFNCATEGTCSGNSYKVWTTIAGPIGGNPIIRTRPAIRTATSEGTSAILVGEILYLGGADRDVWFQWGEEEDLSDLQETEEETVYVPSIFSKKIDFAESFGKTYYFRAVTSVIEEDEEQILTGNILSFTVSEGKGTIKILYRDKEKNIFLGEEGSIEIVRE